MNDDCIAFVAFGTRTCSRCTNSRATMADFQASGPCRRFVRAKAPYQNLPNRRLLKIVYRDRNFVNK